MKIHSYGNTDVGLKRRHNEDSWLIDEELQLYVVADGMGGHQAGEVASQLATQKLPALLRKFDLQETDNIPVILEEVINHIHHEVSSEAHIDPNKKGMGTTLCVLLLQGNTFWSTNIGDSPIFLFRDNELIKITKDQTFVQEQLDRGMISLQEAKEHRYKNVLTQSIGSKKILKIPIISGQLNNNDIFLLCSDGLSNPLDVDDITQVLSDNLMIDQKVNKLIERAKAIDGSDNITSVMVQVHEEDEEESLISDDTIKFENVYAQNASKANTSQDSKRDGSADNNFEPEIDYNDEELAKTLNSMERSQGAKTARWVLSLATLLLLAILIYLSLYFSGLQKKDESLFSHNIKEGASFPENIQDDAPPRNAVPSVRPSIKTEDDIIQTIPETPDLPTIEPGDQYIDLDIIDKPFEEEPESDAQVQVYQPDHFSELKNSFIHNVYPEKSVDRLNHLCVRFGQYISQFPDKFTIRKAAFQRPEISVFQQAFLNIVKNSGDFFLVMKDSDGIRTYILYLGLYDTFEEARSRSGDGKVFTIREVLEKEPLILQ